jgi:hypothetical protein
MAPDPLIHNVRGRRTLILQPGTCVNISRNLLHCAGAGGGGFLTRVITR